MKKLILIGGARPNFIKIAPLAHKLSKERKFFSTKIVHTGQHYDFLMSKVFFEDLSIPEPDSYLGIGSASHAKQTARILERLEPILLSEKPDLVVVVGDVNSTLAAALCTAKLNIPLAHVEAGLRSFDKSMPEEINRILTDHLSDFLFASCEEGVVNLLSEGIDPKKIFFVGNIMIDSLKNYLQVARKRKVCKNFNLEEKNYALATIHRPENVDKKENLEFIMNTLEKISSKIEVIYPVHPRSSKTLKQYNLIRKIPRLIMTEPLSYINFLSLMSDSKLVITDSGGIQEETTFLKIPCLTLRYNTERNITTWKGTNVLVGRDEKKILYHLDRILKDKFKKGKTIPKWDGKTADRIVIILKKRL